MRYVTAVLLSVFLIACSPSSDEKKEGLLDQKEDVTVEEKEEIAKLTCNILVESGNKDGATRIKEINSAREQMGEKKYIGTNEEIKEANRYGLCKELVRNDPEYGNKLKALKEREYMTRLN